MKDTLDMVKKLKRMAGILLHPTSLPGEYGIGDFGPEAYAFVDFLKESGQHIWQTLPLGATGEYNSPYQCYSSFAGNVLLISPELLVKDGLLTKEDIENHPEFDEAKVDFDEVKKFKAILHKKAFENFKALSEDDSEEAAELKASFEKFQENFWLRTFATFMAIKKSKDNSYWLDWEKKYRKPTKKQREVIERELSDEIMYEEFLQWIFYKQWDALKAYANENGILIVGDIPIFVATDSADVWAEPKLFQLDSDGFPKVVSGVPPDYFSKTGQLWGNPLYNWRYHKKTGFEWWIKRISAQLKLCDIVRIDHFRGLESYWEIPAGETTAMNGKWKPGPGSDFFDAVIEALGDDLPIIAEDLGIITDEVRELRDKYNLPGMKILQFAFDGGDNDYLPYNQPYNCICYTGTHDNDTTAGWYASASEVSKDIVRRYMNTDASQISWDFIRTCYGSPARYAIVPVQDILCEGTECRMNVPGVAEGNWAYRVKSGALNQGIAERLRLTTELFHR